MSEMQENFAVEAVHYQDSTGLMQNEIQDRQEEMDHHLCDLTISRPEEC